MRNLLLRSAVTGFALAATTHLAGAQAAPVAASPEIVTSGSGEAMIEPDRATVFVGVETRAGTAAAAGTENARRLRAVLDTLRALGLNTQELSTVGYGVSPEMQYSQSGNTPPKVVGYTVTNTVRAEVGRLDKVGGVIDAALAKGANEVSSLEFYSSRADSVHRAALANAVANARADAEVIAHAAGGSLGPLVSISAAESPIRFPQPVMMSKMAQGPTTPIEAGEQSFSATVTAQWAFVAKP